MALGPHTIVRLRAGTITDPYSGEETPGDWTTPAESTIAGCSVQPGSPRPQDLNDRDSVTILYTVWAPIDADVTEHDRVRYAGRDYAVDDTIQRWDFPPLSHLVIPLTRVEG